MTTVSRLPASAGRFSCPQCRSSLYKLVKWNEHPEIQLCLGCGYAWLPDAGVQYCLRHKAREEILWVECHYGDFVYVCKRCRKSSSFDDHRQRRQKRELGEIEKRRKKEKKEKESKKKG
jgi:Zn ribbon nucleic-acid-binding protein